MKKTANGQDTFNLIYESRLYSFFIIDNKSIKTESQNSTTEKGEKERTRSKEMLSSSSQQFLNI